MIFLLLHSLRFVQFDQESCPAGEYLHSERLWMLEKVSAALNTTPTTIPQTPHISKNPQKTKKINPYFARNFLKKLKNNNSSANLFYFVFSNAKFELGQITRNIKAELNFWRNKGFLFFRFKTPPDDNRRQINAAINDKLDIICPRYGKGNKEELFYFKLYLVSEKNFQKCNSTGGRRLLTCNIPNKEKKYTFYFQQLSPSPWGLEFQPGKAYYVICKSFLSFIYCNLIWNI